MGMPVVRMGPLTSGMNKGLSALQDGTADRDDAPDKTKRELAVAATNHAGTEYLGKRKRASATEYLGKRSYTMDSHA